MSNDIIQFDAKSTDLAGLTDMFGDGNSDLKEGVTPSFATVSVRGKVWRVTYKGESRIIKTPEGEPVPAIPCVLVKASKYISKIYYEKAYAEGDDESPDCFSLNGLQPDVSAPKPQSKTCAACPKNVFGSRVTENGNKAKACADTRRVAVVPYPDIENKAFGGPMLMRVPPTSLQELVKYADQLSQVGAPYQGVVTRISFDPEMSYPRLVFRGLRALTRDEAVKIKAMMDSDQVDRMLDHGTLPEEGEAPEPVKEKPKAEAPKAEPKAEAPKEEPKAEAPKEEPKAEAPKEEPKSDDAGMDFGGFNLGEPETKEETKPAADEEKKPSPAKQAAAPADDVTSALDSMIDGLLNS